MQSAIGSLTGVGAGETAIFVVRNTAGTETGIFAFEDDGSGNTTVAAGELDLLAVVDAQLDNNDLAVA